MKASIASSVVLVMVLAVAGCETTGMGERETAGTVGGTVVGGVLGAVAGDGDEGAVLVGAALGGLIGNRIGAFLDERERRAMAEASVEAAEAGDTGEQVAWSVPDEEGTEQAASGWVTPTSDPYEQDGRTCRDVRQVARKGETEREQEVTMCRRVEAGSEWEVPAS